MISGMVAIMQVGAVLNLFLFCAYLIRETVRGKCIMGGEERSARHKWVIRTEQIVAEEIPLLWKIRSALSFRTANTGERTEVTNGRYIMGNRFCDDIMLRTAGERVKLHVNVLKDKVLITVLKGSLKFRNYTYRKNSKFEIEVREFEDVFVGDVHIQFYRKKV